MYAGMESHQKGFNFWLPLALLGAIFAIMIGAAACGIASASTEQRSDRVWKAQQDLMPHESFYVCPKCGSHDTKIQYHRKDQVRSCLGRPCDIDHLAVECKRCGFEGYDPK